jgi:hypothetical protein
MGFGACAFFRGVRGPWRANDPCIQKRIWPSAGSASPSSASFNKAYTSGYADVSSTSSVVEHVRNQLELLGRVFRSEWIELVARDTLADFAYLFDLFELLFST